MPSLEGLRDTVWPELCCAMRLRWAREKWIRSLFCCLCMQFQVDNAEELAVKLRVCMDRDDSIIYVAFGFEATLIWLG